MTTVAVLGLGEAGARYAADLLTAGVEVAGYDPVARPELTGLRLADTPTAAVGGADVILSLNAASVAERVARDAAGGLGDGAVYADLNTGSPESKRRIAATVAATPAQFADAAVLAPVPRNGLRTPLLLAGDGRTRLAAFLEPFGVPVEDAGAEPGAAAARKLLRSVFMKGMAAVIMEALEAAGAAGQEPWLRAQIVTELAAADAALADRLVDGTHQHAARRLEEMTAASSYLEELHTGHQVTDATVARLHALAHPEADR